MIKTLYLVQKAACCTAHTDVDQNFSRDCSGWDKNKLSAGLWEYSVSFQVNNCGI